MFARPRPLFLAVLAALSVAASADLALAGAAVPNRLCAPLLPARVPLPARIGLPPLAATSLPVSPHAFAHLARCRVGVYSPSDGARYNVNWYVFPSHAQAVADLK